MTNTHIPQVRTTPRRQTQAEEAFITRAEFDAFVARQNALEAENRELRAAPARLSRTQIFNRNKNLNVCIPFCLYMK